jgi:hypothetical protein
VKATSTVITTKPISAHRDQRKKKNVSIVLAPMHLPVHYGVVCGPTISWVTKENIEPNKVNNTIEKIPEKAQR